MSAASVELLPASFSGTVMLRCVDCLTLSRDGVRTLDEANEWAADHTCPDPEQICRDIRASRAGGGEAGR